MQLREVTGAALWTARKFGLRMVRYLPLPPVPVTLQNLRASPVKTVPSDSERFPGAG